MNKLIKYNLEIMTAILAAFIVVGFMKGAGITIKEFQTNMKKHMISRIKGKK